MSPESNPPRSPFAKGGGQQGKLLLPILSLLLLAACSGEGGGGQALVGVTVIDGLGNPPQPHQVVWMEDGRIREVTPVAGWTAPRGVQEIDLAGRFVLPGLIDMHAHVTILPVGEDGRLAETADPELSARVLETLLAFGVTTVRNPAAPAEDGVRLRDQVASGEILGPRILTAGDALARTDAGFGPFTATPDAAAVRAEVERQAKAGVDFVKVYASLPPELVAAAIEAAHARQLEVVGHLQRTPWTEAAELGIDALTHSAPWSAAYLPESEREGDRGSLRDRVTWLEKVDFDGPEIQRMIAVLGERRIPVDPTLIALHTKFFGDQERHLENPELHLAPHKITGPWKTHNFVADWTPDDFARAQAAWDRQLELTRRMHQGGVLLTAGSDLPNPWVIPGVSLHQELRLLADAGIPPLEVIRIATHNAAVALGLDAEIGSIEPGKVADLIVLAANPTVLIKNSRAISHVFQGGRYLDPAALLDSQLD